MLLKAASYNPSLLLQHCNLLLKVKFLLPQVPQLFNWYLKRHWCVVHEKMTHKHNTGLWTRKHWTGFDNLMLIELQHWTSGRILWCSSFQCCSYLLHLPFFCWCKAVTTWTSLIDYKLSGVIYFPSGILSRFFSCATLPNSTKSRETNSIKYWY